MTPENYLCAGAMHITAIGDMLVTPLFRSKLGDPSRIYIQRAVADYVIGFEEVDLDPADRVLPMNDGRELAVGDRPLFGFYSLEDGLFVGNRLQMISHLSGYIEALDGKPSLRRVLGKFLTNIVFEARAGLEATGGGAPHPLLEPLLAAAPRVPATPRTRPEIEPAGGSEPNKGSQALPFVDVVIGGDAIEAMRSMRSGSVDLVFADPPHGSASEMSDWKLTGTDRLSAHSGDGGAASYHDFTRAWLSEARRVLKDDGSLWIMGGYHNIFRIGAVLQDLGLWILNDIVWRKSNPMPNFRGTRFTNSHETLIWATKSRESRYTFNYRSMKTLNDELQMGSEWTFPTVGGTERLRGGQGRLLATQKPEALLYRILLATTKPGDLVLDPFFGTGTTGVAAKRLGRHWIGIEADAGLCEAASERIAAAEPLDEIALAGMRADRPRPKVAFGQLVEAGVVQPGEVLTDSKRRFRATVLADGSLLSGADKGSIHKLGATLQGVPTCNGWTFWNVEKDGSLMPLDTLRGRYLLAHG